MISKCRQQQKCGPSSQFTHDVEAFVKILWCMVVQLSVLLINTNVKPLHTTAKTKRLQQMTGSLNPTTFLGSTNIFL